MGKNNSLELSLAMLYLPYLGTSRYTAAEIQQEFSALAFISKYIIMKNVAMFRLQFRRIDGSWP